jgi:microsomal dipeptidase-like Zn-dependent dipeptidase
LLADNSDIVRLVLDGDDIRRAKEEDRVGIVFGFQNASPLEDEIDLVRAFRRLGVRIIQLTYNNQNLLGGGCYEAQDAGLGRFGREVVKEMNRAGLLVDLSHVGERTCLDAISTGTRPAAITHANPAGMGVGDPAYAPRLKSEEVMRALAESGGVMGISVYPPLLAGGSSATPQNLCEAVAHAVEVMGIDHVAIGTDMCQGITGEDIRWYRSGRWTRTPEDRTPAPWPDWFRTAKDFSNLGRFLSDFGFAEPEVAAIMGENWLRLFDEAFQPRVSGPESDATVARKTIPADYRADSGIE